MIDFPASPTLGQVFTSGAQSWTWDGAKWVASGVYAGPPQFSNANRIINGDMRIDQRGVASGGGSSATQTYTVDRWFYGATQASKGTWVRGGGGVAIIQTTGFSTCLSFGSSSAYTPISTDTFNFQQPIEADMTVDFAWGTPNAQPVTLSFWVNSSLTGAFSGAFYNYPTPSTRSYPFTYSIPVANTWTKIALTIPGDTAGTWVMSGNPAGAGISFDLGSGVNFRGPANAWANGNYRGATGSVSVIGTNGATFNLTGVKLEIGSVATPFNRKSPQESLADCQRYYQQWNAGAICVAQAYGTGAAVGVIPLMTTMRASPTIAGTLISLNAAGSNNAAFSGGTMNGSPYEIILNVSGTTGLVAGNATELSVAAGTVLTASAEL